MLSFIWFYIYQEIRNFTNIKQSFRRQNTIHTMKKCIVIMNIVIYTTVIVYIIADYYIKDYVYQMIIHLVLELCTHVVPLF